MVACLVVGILPLEKACGLVLFSDLISPPAEAPKCTLMAAVALTKAFHKMGLADAGIKWPNDILVNGRKLVGILTEMSGSMEEISYIVMGIGGQC